LDFVKIGDKAKNAILNVIGVLFLVWGIAAVLNSLYLLNPNQIFWNCYIGLLLLGIGILIRNSKLVGAQLAILGIPLIVWDIDFIYYLVFNDSLWGITDYIFLTQRLAVSQIISLQHLFTLPVGVFALYLMRVKRFDFWKVALVQVSLLFVVISVMTSPYENIGCVFESCLSVDISVASHIPYKVLWFVSFLGMIFIMNFILWRLRFLRDSKVEKEMFGKGRFK